VYKLGRPVGSGDGGGVVLERSWSGVVERCTVEARAQVVGTSECGERGSGVNEGAC